MALGAETGPRLSIHQATKRVFSNIFANIKEFEEHDSGTIFEAPEKLSKRQKIKKNFFYIKDQFIPKKITEFLTFIFASNLEIKGKENLKKTHEMTNNKQIIFISNHLSNFDAPAFEYALTATEFGEMKEKVIYLQGIKLDKNPAVKFFLGSFKRIKVWPTSLPPRNAKEKRERSKMIKDSLTSSEKALQENYNLVIFAEGGRSYNGKLKEGEPAVTHYLNLHPDAVVVPVSISGTEKILPRGSIILVPLPATITFGEPIEVKALDEMFKHLPNGEKRKPTIDFIMGKIAQNLPEKYRGVYADKV